LQRKGNVWAGGHDAFYEAQQETAAATASQADAVKGVKEQTPVEWKANALRHPYASYRFALTGDAGRAAGELGNSAAVVHRHYRELVKPEAPAAWFDVRPEAPRQRLGDARGRRGALTFRNGHSGTGHKATSLAKDAPGPFKPSSRSA
jgi:hypothetical protein